MSANRHTVIGLYERCFDDLPIDDFAERRASDRLLRAIGITKNDFFDSMYDSV